MNGREGGREGETGWYWAIKPESDTQSASHALAQAIVVWNLRNAFDRFGVSVWVLFWMTPGDKTATREGKERRGRRGRGQGLPDEYVYFHSTFEKPACSVFFGKKNGGPFCLYTEALHSNEEKENTVWHRFFNVCGV